MASSCIKHFDEGETCQSKQFKQPAWVTCVHVLLVVRLSWLSCGYSNVSLVCYNHAAFEACMISWTGVTMDDTQARSLHLHDPWTWILSQSLPYQVVGQRNCHDMKLCLCQTPGGTLCCVLFGTRKTQTGQWRAFAKGTFSAQGAYYHHLYYRL